MAQVTGAKSTYQEPIHTGGNREDLSDVLYDVSPTDTPFLTMCKKGKADGTYHEWLTDELEEPAKNAVVEGHVAEPKKAGSRTRIGNYTQILEKTASVTGSQEKAKKGGGIKSEMAYQVTRRMKEIKRDLERTVIGASPQIAKAGSDSVAREMASFVNFMNDDSYMALASSGVTKPTGDGKTQAVPGALTVFTEDHLIAALAKMWTNTSGSENISAIMGASIRGKFSKFQSSATRYVSTDNARLQASIDVYDGDFHTVTAVPDRYSNPASVFLVDWDYVSIDDYRPIFTQDLATTGDGKSKQIIWETTLKVGNPKAHMVIDGAKAA